MASILIIDDDVTLLARLGAQLEDAGHLVAKASDLSNAHALFAEQRPDLVVLEVRTGEDGGWDLLHQLTAEVPVVVLSGAGREEDVVRGFAAGAVDYVTKPYRSDELQARLRARLAGAGSFAPAASVAPEPSAPGPSTTTTKPLTPPARRRGRRDEPADETVFMSEAEEMALLRMPVQAAARATTSAAAEPDEATSLGRRLRSERQRRHLTLVQIENDLKIRMSYLQAMEDEKYTLLPRGPAAIQMVRSYADYLGLDAGALAEEFRTLHYAEPTEPPPALGGASAPRSLPRWAIVLAAILLALAVAVGAIYALDPSFFQNLPAALQSLWQQILGLFGAGG